MYSVVYLDPPWEYRNNGLNGAAEQHYPTISTDKLCELPDYVNLRCAPDSVLFMWATSPLLPDALRIIEAWNFEYKASMVWLKDAPTYGKLRFYVSTRHELLLIATRGSFQPIVMPDSVIEAPRKKHSEKPDIYSLIEAMYPNQRYLELFARNVQAARPTWTYWGNEAHAKS